MNEEMFQQFLNIINDLEIVLHAVCIAWFLGAAYFRKQNRKMYCLIVFASYIAVYVLRVMVLDIPGWVSCIVIFVELWLMLWKKEHPRFEYLAFLLVTWYCVLNICVLIVYSLNTLITDKMLEHFQNMENFFLQLMIVSVLSAGIRAGLIFGMMLLLEKRIDSCMNMVHGRNLIYLLLTPVAGAMFGNIIVKVMLVVKDDTYFNLYEEYPSFLWIVPAVGLLFYMGILFSISAYGSMVNLQEERKKNFVEEQKVSALKNRIEEVEQFYDTARRMKHDMRNHMTAIKGLIAKGNFEEVDAYMNQMEQSMGVFDFSIKTGNAVTDVIINDFRNRAQKEGIRFKAEFVLGNDVAIEAFDMGIIISNLLDNALEACRTQKDMDKQIHIAGRKKKKFYFIEVKNSFTGKVQFHDRTGLPISTKTDKESLHGIGLENVSKIAEKYLGSMDINIENNMFCVTVMLQEKGFVSK